ncbi:hypothetical protein SAMN04488028_101647 [Reichenbachiella agariperforans]|uniref:Uncharacterized protein n=1 Tax=Reichenbachiella agariperforans TaxID=156994 RepID=A0A1M6KNM7_REIAG|nr:hypothetical protein [Reichenbachiella agariperforans]SHJ60539.1 hypothetical protein SAMN04488028_101647 [Reichenbachiella agariperforans]
MFKRILYGVFLSLEMLLSNGLHAQVDVSILDLGGDLEAWYQETIALKNTPIAVGAYYHIQPQSIKEHQFFLSPVWEEGSVHISDEFFQDIRMLYNTYEDILIVENSGIYRSSYQPLKPNQQAIGSFSIHGAEFIRLDANEILPGGFYELLYEGGQARALVKRIKIKRVASQGIEYETQDVLYLQLGSVYHKYRGRKTFYELFPDHKKEIKSYIRSQGITNLNRHNESGFVYVLQFCEKFMPAL